MPSITRSIHYEPGGQPMSLKATIPGTEHGVICPNGDGDDHQKILNARFEICRKYCREKGWPEDFKQLSITQVMEMTDTDEWRTAGGLIKDKEAN